MAFSLDKIKLGRKNKNAFFDMSHDVNTTSDFGFCQPTLIKHVIPGSKISLKTSAFVRLAPLVSPSFARVRAEFVTRYVPMTDVFEGFNYMQAQKEVQSFNSKYIPVRADYITVSQLLIYAARVTCIHNPVSQLEDFKPLLLPVVFKSSQLQTTVNRAFLEPLERNNFALAFQPIMNDDDFLPGDFQHFLFRDKSEALRLNNSWLFHVWNSYANDIPLYGQFSYIGKPTLDNADFILTSTNQSTDVLALYLTKEGKRFFKILYGLGIDFSDLNAKVPLHLFFAYYKAWFDTFNPGRDQHWRSTNCYRLIHQYYDTGDVLYYQLADDGSQSPAILWLMDFFKDLLKCCYTLDVDPLTVCQVNPWENTQFSTVLEGSLPGGDELNTNLAHLDANDPSYIKTTNMGYFDSISLFTLQKSLSFISKDSVLAHKVKDLLKTRYNITTFEESNYIGSHGFNLQISDVTNLAQSDGNPLGEYAGKGVGSGETDNMKYHTNDYGIVVQFMYIKPIGGYSQSSLQECLVEKNDFYQPDFDSVGFEAVPKSAIFGSSSIPHYGGNQIFGFRPRMMRHKYMTNKRNGEFHNRSQKDYFSTYQLDRMFDEPIIKDYNGSFGIDFGVQLQSSEELRYIGVTESFGNYDRLFYDRSGNSDNFIVHIYNDFKIWSPMLPVSESFMTYDDNLNGDTDTTEVQHS